MTVQLRPGHLADVFRMQEIERAAAELFRGTDLIDVDAMTVLATSEHLAAIDEGLSITAESGGRIAGFVIGDMHGSDAYLRELDVDPDFQKRGIGAALVNAFIEAARKKGAKMVYLSTFRSPPWNAPFYRKLGFRDVAHEDCLPWMTAIWQAQAVFLDMDTRIFMKLDV